MMKHANGPVSSKPATLLAGATFIDNAIYKKRSVGSEFLKRVKGVARNLARKAHENKELRVG